MRSWRGRPIERRVARTERARRVDLRLAAVVWRRRAWPPRPCAEFGPVVAAGDHPRGQDRAVTDPDAVAGARRAATTQGEYYPQGRPVGPHALLVLGAAEEGERRVVEHVVAAPAVTRHPTGWWAGCRRVERDARGGLLERRRDQFTTQAQAGRWVRGCHGGAATAAATAVATAAAWRAAAATAAATAAAGLGRRRRWDRELNSISGITEKTVLTPSSSLSAAVNVGAELVRDADRRRGGDLDGEHHARLARIGVLTSTP